MENREAALLRETQMIAISEKHSPLSTGTKLTEFPASTPNSHYPHHKPDSDSLFVPMPVMRDTGIGISQIDTKARRVFEVRTQER